MGTTLLEITILGRDAVVTNSWDSLFTSLIELSMGNTDILFDMLFNIVLFIPFGVLIIMQMIKVRAVLCVVLLSLFVESLQLATGRGLFELSDLLMKCIGGLLGMLAYLLIRSLVFKWKN